MKPRAWLLGLLLILAGCDIKNNTTSGASGPLDGNYAVSGWTCDSGNLVTFLSDAGAQSKQVSVTNTSGKITLGYSASCSSTEPLTLSYPGGSTVTAAFGAISCASACASTVCASASSTLTSTYNYTINGNTVTLTRKLSQPSGYFAGSNSQYLCETGQTETLTLTKQ
jgi:hypothetical protein